MHRSPPSTHPTCLLRTWVRWIAIVSFCVVMSSVFVRPASTSVVSEYQVKAAFIFNFIKFTEWPAGVFDNPHTPITLCIYGSGPFDEALTSIEGKLVKGRRLIIERLPDGGVPAACHILFISASEKRRLSALLDTLKNLHVLTIGDMSRFAHAGGMINFIMVGNKVRFEINRDAAQRAGLKISSKLLQLARLVKDGVE